jgi:hypothetical protein
MVRSVHSIALIAAIVGILVSSNRWGSVGASDVGTTIDVPQWEGKLLGKEYIKTPGGVTDPAKQVIKE